MLRTWIRKAGAPETGSIGDNKGRRSKHLAELLGACLPDRGPVEVAPLRPPSPGQGVQLVMPPHPVPAGSEVGRSASRLTSISRARFPSASSIRPGSTTTPTARRGGSDPNTRHIIIVMKPTVSPLDRIDDPSFGGWVCAEGDRAGETCDPSRSGCVRDQLLAAPRSGTA